MFNFNIFFILLTPLIFLFIFTISCFLYFIMISSITITRKNVPLIILLYTHVKPLIVQLLGITLILVIKSADGYLFFTEDVSVLTNDSKLFFEIHYWYNNEIQPILNINERFFYTIQPEFEGLFLNPQNFLENFPKKWMPSDYQTFFNTCSYVNVTGRNLKTFLPMMYESPLLFQSFILKLILLFEITILITALILVQISDRYILYNNKNVTLYTYEYFFLFLLSICAILAIFFCNNFIGFFLILELSSFIIYLLIGLKLSQVTLESSLKYFMIASLGGLFFLLGLSLFYGLYGVFDFEDIKRMLRS